MITYSTHIDDRTYLLFSRFMFILAVGVAVYKYENVLFTTQSNKTAVIQFSTHRVTFLTHAHSQKIRQPPVQMYLIVFENK